MADEQVGTGAAEVAAEVDAQEAQGTSAETQNTDNAQEHMIPKSRFDEVNSQLKQLKTDLEKAAKEREKAEQAALAEQGKFKELYEQERQQREDALAKMRKLQHDSLRRQVAQQAGHPALWNRIHGETEEELEADMQTLVDAMPRPTAPTLDGGAGNGKRGGGKATPTEAEMREMAAVYGVSYDALKQQYGG